MNFELKEEVKQIRTMVRGFVENEVQPFALQIEEKD